MQLPRGHLVRMGSCSSRGWRGPQGLRHFLWFDSTFADFLARYRITGSMHNPATSCANRRSHGMATSKETDFVSIEHIAQSILFVRGRRALLDSDLAAMYGVADQAIQRTGQTQRGALSADFAFHTAEESKALKSQIATSTSGRGRHSKYTTYAFTEHGAIKRRTASIRSQLRSSRCRRANVASGSRAIESV